MKNVTLKSTMNQTIRLQSYLELVYNPVIILTRQENSNTYMEILNVANVAMKNNQQSWIYKNM